VLEGLRDAIEKRAAQVILDTSGSRNGRVLATEQQRFHKQDSKASGDLKHEPDKFLTKKVEGDVASGGAMIAKGDNNHQTCMPIHAGLKRKARDQNECARKKSRGDGYVMNDGILGEAREARVSDHEGHEEATDSHIEGEPEDIEADDPPPSTSAVLAKYAAGERRGRKWRGRTTGADMPTKRNVGGIAEGNVSDDEQVIIGEDNDFWRER